MSINYKFAPLVAWPRQFTPAYNRKSPFQATYTDTIDKLTYELDKLGAREVIIQVALQPKDIRQDGLPRSNANKPVHPGVIITFESKKTGGTVSFPCDACTTYQ